MKRFNQVKKFAPRVLAFVGTGFVTSSAYAVDLTAQIGAASTEANTNQTAVITAILGLAVLSFGVGMLVRWLNK